MKTLLCRSLLFFGIISTISSCQTSRVAFQARPFGRVAATPTDTTVLLLHDSQGPQATRVTLTASEAAQFRQE
jgi:hypothetical protein